MGLRDALKSLRGNKNNDADAEISEAEAPDATWFRPRHDGVYESALPSTSPSAVSIQLRFLAGGKVVESRDADSALGSQSSQCRGEYTAAGRFNVQRQFERIISYAVLDTEPDAFLARRINTADRDTVELRFAFRPDSEGRV
jgi:hypothetical protein